MRSPTRERTSLPADGGSKHTWWPLGCMGRREGRRVWCVLALLAAGALFLPVRWGLVVGSSMLPTLATGQPYLSLTLPAGSLRLHRGDLVIARLGGKTVVKRVVALPEDTVVLLRRPGSRETLPASASLVSRALRGRLNPFFARTFHMEQVTLGKDEYFLIGDNRGLSRDSRADGPVHRRDVRGKVIVPERGAPNLPDAVYSHPLLTLPRSYLF